MATNIPIYPRLYDRPPANTVRSGDKCKVTETGFFYLSNGMDWEYAPGSVDTSMTWAAKTSASEFGIGQAYFSDIEAMAYSDGAQWMPLSNNFRETNLKIAVYGDSTANTADTQSPANNDISTSTAPIPGSGTTTVLLNQTKIGLAALYPSAAFVTNCGVSGRTVATMVTDESSASTISTRKAIDTANNSPDVILFRGGSINDFVAASYPITDNAYNTILANHKKCLHWLASTGAVVIDEGIFGYSKGLPTYGADANGDAVRVALVRFNNDMRAYIADLNSPKIKWLEPVGLSCDSTGARIAGTVSLADGTHDTIYSALLRGIAEKSLIEQIFGKSKNIRHIGANTITNALFLATGSSGIGIVPTGFQITNPLNCTRQNGVIEVLDGRTFSTMELLATAAGSVSVNFYLPFNPLAGGLNVGIGDIYGFEVDIYIENTTTGYLNGRFFTQIVADITDSTNAKHIRTGLDSPDDSAPITGKYYGPLYAHLAAPPYVFQEAAASYGTSTTLQVTLGARCEASDVLKVGISNPRVVKL